MASTYSSPAGKEKGDLDTTASKTPLRSTSTSSNKNYTYAYKSSSSGSNDRDSSEHPKSFLALDAESSPITIAGSSPSMSASPQSTTSSTRPVAESLRSAIGQLTNQNRYHGETSFFAMTSPLASRSVAESPQKYGSSFDNDEAGGSNLRVDPAKSSANTRGSRLGAQMGRTRSIQPTSLDTRTELPLSPGTRTFSGASTSPTRTGGAGDALFLGSSGSLTTPMRTDYRSYSQGGLGTEDKIESSGPVSPLSSSSPRVGSAGAEAILSPRNLSSQPVRTPIKRLETPPFTQRNINLSPTSQSGLARRIEEEKSQAAGAYKMSPGLQQQGEYETRGRLSRTSSHGDLYSATTSSSSSSVISPGRQPKGSTPQAGLPRIGKLSRLQYTKVDPISSQIGPTWNMSTSSNGSTPLSNRPILMGRLSKPSIPTDFKSEADSDGEAYRHDSSPLDVSSTQDVFPSADVFNRPIERRELMLPALNEMRNAVQSVILTPSEMLLKQGEGRRPSNANQQSTPMKDESRILNFNQQTQQGTPRETTSNHGKIPSLENNPSPTMTDELWQRVNEAPRPNESITKQDFNLSSSPTQSSITTTRQASSRSGVFQSSEQMGAKVGQLSDEVIVQLGAVPGVDSSSLLNANGQPLSSKNILTIALQKAQSAVLLDSANNVPDAILAYRQAVRLLEEVMERVSPKNTSSSRRKTSREEERRRLKVIHDTYADRIRLLSMIYSPEDDLGDDLGDSSMGDDSFARQSPTPHPANKLEEKNLVEGLGIEQGDDDSTKGAPHIAISGVNIEDHPVEDREELLDVSRKQHKHHSLHRSDSDSSFQSATNLNSTLSVEVNGGLQPPMDRHLTNKRNSASEEEHVTPATPYFDIDSSFISTETSPFDSARDDAEGRDGTGRPISTLSPLRSAHLIDRRSRSPQDRISRGNSSLHNVPSATAIAASENGRRFLSIGSQAQFEKQVSSSPSSSKANQLNEDQPPSNLKSLSGKESPLSGRPRALTLNQNEQGRLLVSTNVSSGTISQRRRMAAESSEEPRANDERAYGSQEGTYSQASSSDMGDRGNIDFGSKGQTSEEEFDPRTGVKVGSGRKRAVSQPSNRRPTIPTSFFMNNQPPPGSPHGPPPVPKIKRKASMPLSPLANLQQQQQQGTIRAPSALGTSSFRFPSPAPSTSSGYHALGTPLSPFNNYPWSNQTIGGYNSEGKGTIMSDLFPTSLPSIQMNAVPSFTSNSHSTHLPWIGITNSSLSGSNSIAPPPTQKFLRPFYTMKLLQASIEHGSYITKRLYLPAELWLQSGSRLLAIETKVRMLESISSGIDGIDQAGQFLLHPTHTDQPGLNAINASKFLKLLEEFETLLIEVQNTLAKKLGFLETVHGKKASNSFGSLGSKLTRSLDRMTNNVKHLDTPATYVEGLSRLFVKAQVLGDHLSTLYRSKMGGQDFSSPTTKEVDWDRINVDIYATLPAELKSNIEFKLKRSSDFFANVILRFVLRDVAILMDK